MEEIPPPAPPADPPQPDGIEIPHKENANFFLYVVDFYRSTLEEIIAKVPPMQIVFLLAFLQGAIESQLAEAAGAFEECREFFRAVYPPFMQGHILSHPDEAPKDDEILIIIPTPSPMIGLTQDDTPRIITPGSSKVN